MDSLDGLDTLDSLDSLDAPELVTVISPDGTRHSLKANCIFPMSAFSSLLPLKCYGGPRPDLGGDATPTIDLRKSDPGFKISDTFIALACEFLTVRNGVDLYVVKPGEKFGFDRKKHDIMNPLYISDNWRDSIKNRDEWLASLGERFVPDPVVDPAVPKMVPGPDGKEITNPVYAEAVGHAFHHGMNMYTNANWFGVNGVMHLVAARIKFITRHFFGKKDEWAEFVAKYRP